MMTFEEISKDHFIATNSIKSVRISKVYGGNWMLFTPEGRLLDEFTSAGPFVEFEAAKRNAEMNVGMYIKFEETV